MGIAKSKNGRMVQHDEIAIPMVVSLFQEYGFIEHVAGQESDNGAIRSALKGKRDITSLMFRFRPDRLFIHPNHPPFLCEVKSEGKEHGNFSIEFDSYIAAKGHGDIYKNAIYAFVDLGGIESQVGLCWVRDIPFPGQVLIPMRFDWKDNRDYIQVNYPTIRPIFIDHKFGSGTPFFVIPKSEYYLKPFDEFMKTIGISNKPEQLSLF